MTRREVQKFAIYSAILIPRETPQATAGKVKFVTAEGKGVARKLFEKRYPDKIVTNLYRLESKKS